MPDFVPIKAVSYVALPCKGLKDVNPLCSPPPPADLVQAGYQNQWGEEGRDDLGTISRLGANAVRVWKSFGIESAHSHGQFLDRAQEVGLYVIPGFETDMVCDDFDCYQSWYNAATTAFNLGYLSGGAWHPTIRMIVLLDQPDALNFQGTITPPEKPTTDAGKAKARVRASLSALDGFLRAEQDAQVTDTDKVNITIAWGTGPLTSIDGKETGYGYYGFQDMIAGVADPSIADYTLKGVTLDELQAAYKSRWTNSMDSYSDWDYIRGKLDPKYDSAFPNAPWFLSSFDGNKQSFDSMVQDLTETLGEAKKGGSFLGVTFRQFQLSYDVPNTAYGMFGLGDGTIGIGETGDVCQEDVIHHTPTCQKWPVFCLTSTTETRQPEAIAKVWNGTFESRGLCTSKSNHLVV